MYHPGMTIGVYAGSYDPFTFGHEAVARDSLRVVRRLVIAIGKNRAKTPLLSPEKRSTSAKSYFGPGDPVEVVPFYGALADFCFELPERGDEEVVIIRGLRAVSDFEQEMAIAAANRKLRREIQTIFIPTNPEFAFVSSTTVREIAAVTRSKERLMNYVNERTADMLLGA